MSDPNPWIAAATARPDPPVADDTTGAAPHPEPVGPSVADTGAATPQAGVAPLGPGLPSRSITTTAALWVVGAHGGAGESTLADLDPQWAAAGHAWPVDDRTELPPAVVLVARTHAAGLTAAQHALAQWASGGAGSEIALLGLILVNDAPGRLPKPLRHLADHVAGGAPRVWHLGWIEEWRLGLPPTETRRSRQLTRLLGDLTLLLTHRTTS